MKKWITVIFLCSLLCVCVCQALTFETAQKGRALIKKYEGCRITAYRCPAGVWTIGYGHTRTAKAGMIITKEKAELLLIEDLRRFEKYVNSLIELQFKQNKFDALVSFSYNCGYRLNKIKREINRSEDFKVCNFLQQFKYAKGKLLIGLVRRRAEECNLYRESANESN